jgi:gamma-glutamyltranspeptidase/glutathione hydrolase
MRRAADAVEAGAVPIEHGDTIYLAVADREGNMVSLIQSNFSGMGSGMTPPGLGFILQNRGELFSLDPVHANIYAPRKRPFHTIIPAFVTRAGEPWLAFGVMGGAMQPQGHVQVLLNMIDFGMNLQQAGDAPRIRHVGSAQPTGEHAAGGGEIWMESGFDAAVIAELQRRGHRTDIRGQAYGGYQAIARDRDNGVWVGASESRKDGHAAGY